MKAILINMHQIEHKLYVESPCSNQCTYQYTLNYIAYTQSSVYCISRVLALLSWQNTRSGGAIEKFRNTSWMGEKDNFCYELLQNVRGPGAIALMTINIYFLKCVFSCYFIEVKQPRR